MSDVKPPDGSETDSGRSDNVIRPPGWRPEWRDPKKKPPPGKPSRRVHHARARAREELQVDPTLTDEQMRAIALNALVKVAKEGDENGARVAACKALLDETRGAGERRHGEERPLEAGELAELERFVAEQKAKVSA
jgi:hypothetical protein